MNLDVLLPLIILAAGASLTLLLAAFTRRHGLVAAVGIVSTGLFLFSLAGLGGEEAWTLAPLLQVDRLALYFWVLIGFATLVVMLLCYAHFRRPPGADRRLELRERPEEIYGLLLLSSLGACVLSATDHFLGLFLGLELLSLPLFVLIAYRCAWPRPIEAGIKYLVLSGLATGFLLFGIALVYSYTGSLSFGVPTTGPGLAIAGIYWYAGMAMVLAGLAFKLSLVPFHLWTPDVYQGASAPVTAYLSTVSKAAVLAVLLRLSLDLELTLRSPLWSTLAGIAAISMLAGNWLALRQGHLKRLLAYSSIAHMGYVLAALLATGALAIEAVSFYLAFYVTTTLGAFAVIVALSREHYGTEWEADDRNAIRGLFWRRPFLAFALTVMMLSLAGVPLTAGFFGKFYVLLAGSEAGLWRLMLLVVIGSAIGLYYYLRVILIMLDESVESTSRSDQKSWIGSGCVLALLLVTFWLGIYPEPVMVWADALAGP